MKERERDFTKEKNWLDSLKGIAILSVVCVHNGVEGLESNISHQIISQMGSGVQLFFIISGYLAYFSLENYMKDREQTIWEAVKWVILKIIRLMPLYYLSIILSLLLNGTGGRYWLGSLPQITGTNIIFHFLFLHGLNPYYVNSIIGGGMVYWFAGLYVFGDPNNVPCCKETIAGNIFIFGFCPLNLFYPKQVEFIIVEWSTG